MHKGNRTKHPQYDILVQVVDIPQIIRFEGELVVDPPLTIAESTQVIDEMRRSAESSVLSFRKKLISSTGYMDTFEEER